MSDVYQKHEVSEPNLGKWQELVDLIARLFEVPSGLIMRVSEKKIEVLVTSNTEGNPYQAGEQANLDTGLYCETVMATNSALSVPNALQDEKWKNNPDVKLGMISYYGIPLNRADGKIFGTICVLDNKTRQYTELHQALLWEVKNLIEKDFIDSKSTEETRKLLTTAIEQAADTILITDDKARIQYVNPAFEKLTGYTQQEVYGQNPRFISSGKHDSDFYKELWGVISKGKIWHGNIINRRKTGALTNQKTTISPVVDIDGKITNYISVTQDVTEKLILEKQVIQTQKMDIVGQLAGGIAHDFNNMLSIIIGNLELMNRKLEEQEPLQTYLQRAQHAADRATGLTKRLLKFSRQKNESHHPVNVNNILTDVKGLVTKGLTANIQIDLLLSDKLWQVAIESSDFEDAIINLSLNARDAMIDGGTLRIETNNIQLSERKSAFNNIMEPGDYVEISVSDTGTGIPKAILDKVFEPFFTTKSESKGTGLGLSMVYGLIQRSDGYISIESKPDFGTTFRMYLPRAHKIEDGELAGDLNINTKTEQCLTSGQETILVVDDEIELTKLAQIVLSDFGYTVICAHSGEEACRIIRENDAIDLVFSDIVMPCMNGFELAKEIIKIRPELKILLTSGCSEKMMPIGATQQWEKDIIQKPYRGSDIAKKIRQILNE